MFFVSNRLPTSQAEHRWYPSDLMFQHQKNLRGRAFHHD
jgi:hypothetical protein